MRLLLKQFIERPLAAFIFGVEMLGKGLPIGQTIDGMISRMIHTLSCRQEPISERDGDTLADQKLKTGGPGSRHV